MLQRALLQRRGGVDISAADFARVSPQILDPGPQPLTSREFARRGTNELGFLSLTKMVTLYKGEYGANKDLPSRGRICSEAKLAVGSSTYLPLTDLENTAYFLQLMYLNKNF